MFEPLATCRKLVSFTGPGGGGGTGPRVVRVPPGTGRAVPAALALGLAVGPAEPGRVPPICAGFPPLSRVPPVLVSCPPEPCSHFGTSTAPPATATRASTPSPATRDRDSHGLRAGRGI